MGPESHSVYIVEDNPDNATVISMSLTEAGLGHLSHKFASNKQEVDDILDDPNSKPDLIILDLELQGFDGLNVLKKVKENPRLKGTKVIVVTALPHRETVQEKCLALGADGFLGKPFDIDEFGNEVRKVMNL